MDKINIVKHFVIEKEEQNVLDDANNIRPFVIRGTANSGMKDRWNEIMPKDCWNLENFQKNPILLLGHDHSMPIGRITEMYLTETGLKFVAEIGKQNVPFTDKQKEVITLIQQDIYKTFSVGFIAHDYDYDKNTDSLIYKNAELLEISLVTIPMEANALMEGYGYKTFLGKTRKKQGDDMEELKSAFGAMQVTFKTFEDDLKLVKAYVSEKEKELNVKISNLEKELNDKKEENKNLLDDKVKLEEACEELAKIVGV